MMSRRARFRIPILFCGLHLLWLVGPAAICQDFRGGTTGRRLEAGAILGAVTKGRLQLGRLRAGSSIEAELTKPVYSWDQEILPSGTLVRLEVEQVKKQQGRRSLLRAVQKALTLDWRRDASYAVSFRSASLFLPDSLVVPITVSFVNVLEPFPVRSKNEEVQVANDETQKRPYSKLLLQLQAAVELPTLSPAPLRAPIPTNAPTFLPAGTRARLLLEAPLSASSNREGDVFHARLLEPIWAGERLILPEGSRFEGRVARQKPPRRLSRGGSLRLAFDRLILSTGTSVAIPNSISAMEAVDKGVWMDSEGSVRGGSRTKKRALLDLGLSYLVGKLADDLFEEGVKLGVSQAASGTVTVVARYIGIGVGALIFFGQRGKDVRLPLYTELELTFPRDVVLAPLP